MTAMTSGSSWRPNDAKGAGVVHEVVEKGQSVAAAKAWIKGGGKAVQPWDDPKFKIPGGGPYHPAGAQVFIMGNALLRKQSITTESLKMAMLVVTVVPVFMIYPFAQKYFIRGMMVGSVKE